MSQYGDTRRSFKERVKEDPLIPVGCGVTLAILMSGLVSFHKGNSHLSQKLMRARVAAQGATVIALTYGAFASIWANEEKAKNGGETEKEVI